MIPFGEMELHFRLTRAPRGTQSATYDSSMYVAETGQVCSSESEGILV